MFNNFVDHALYTEYRLFNKTGCKFTMTNVYFKKENDIILNGTLCKEGINLCCVHHLQITKNVPPAAAGQGPFSSSCLPWVSCSALTPAGVPPSGLFIVESVLICFIMKNKFAKVYWYAFLYRHIKFNFGVGAECVAWLYTWLACVYFDFVTCNLLFTMRGFL